MNSYHTCIYLPYFEGHGGPVLKDQVDMVPDKRRSFCPNAVGWGTNGFKFKSNLTIKSQLDLSEVVFMTIPHHYPQRTETLSYKEHLPSLSLGRGGEVLLYESEGKIHHCFYFELLAPTWGLKSIPP